MTNEFEDLKTNEFTRRRKLRLQQVREQSKDIAKKIRQRAKVEKLRQVTEVDALKQREYFQKQEKLVKRLELLYANGVRSVGNSHKSALDVRPVPTEKKDLSKQRGKEAAAELKKKTQEHLDKQKKQLDRKLQAREAANEISREKSVNTNKLIAKSCSNIEENKETKNDNKETDGEVNNNNNVVRQDMGTQWEYESVPEWEPNIPILSLPVDDRESMKESNNNNTEPQEKNKRLDLFAVSEEMPSSLRGGLIDIPDERTVRPSLTLVSEYLQNRSLRLREAEVSVPKKSTDLTSIKQTILRSRAKTNVSAKSGDKSKSEEKSTPSSTLPSGSTRKSCVTMYNHSTRDTRDIPCGGERLVIPDSQTDEDAYSQAMKEASSIEAKDRDHQNRLQDMRNKIAMTRQSVEKEYKDTMSFLGSLPKDKGKCVKTAYMDERRQQMLKDSRQRKMQHEYRKIEKECRKHSHLRQESENSRSKSKSPCDRRDEFEERDLQYSWMPVPDGDGSLAVHTIPTTTKEGKTGNTVKFSKVDSYHEYRSRHKHTPPTKDTETKRSKRVVEAVIMSSDSDNSSSSSFEDLRIERKHPKEPLQRKDKELSEAERIIIYKITDAKKKEKEKKKSKLITEIAKSLSELCKEREKANEIDNNNEQTKLVNKGVSVEHLEEGVYKTTKENGDNISSLYFSNIQEQDVVTENEVPATQPYCCTHRMKHQQDTGTIIPEGHKCQSASQTPKHTVDRKCGCSNIVSSVKPTAQPSATSTASFKTAANDKTVSLDGHDAIAEGGYVKLIDDNGHEAGKFYIGASGFLKNDAYELLIQLRKKGMNSQDIQKLQTKATEDKTLNVNEKIQVQQSDQVASNGSNVPKMFDTVQQTVNLQNKNVQSGLGKNTESMPKISETSTIISDEVNQNDEERFISNVDFTKKYSDKSVSTSLQTSRAETGEVPMPNKKTDNNPKSAAISTSTQTMSSPPNQRPVFIHMSSSTSTAYMSPPDIVLPKFLRQDSDERWERQRKLDFHDNEQENFARRKNYGNEPHTHLPSGKTCKYNKTKLQTPPNSVRSYVSDEISDNQHNKCKHRRNKFKSCNSQSGSIKGSNKFNKPCKTQKKPCQHFKMHVGSNVASHRAINPKAKKDNCNLNPVIKNYVDRLLSLNREGMKALDVVNQACSAVTTPGSSIIDVPRNNMGQKATIENKISLEQLKTRLVTFILQDYANNMKPDRNPVKVCKSSKYMRSSKKKPLHKVKSLNISKHLIKTKKRDREQRLNENGSRDTNNILARPIQQQQSVKSKIPDKMKFRSKSSPTPRQIDEFELIRNNTDPDLESYTTINKKITTLLSPPNDNNEIFQLPSNRATTTSERETNSTHKTPMNLAEPPINIATQTSRDVNNEFNYVKLSDDKLQNMEKIADLTEKCTTRLSNLAKVLEEVRRNKLAYSQVMTSDSSSDSDKSEKHGNINSKQSNDPVTEIQNTLYASIIPVDERQTAEDESNETYDSSKYISFLTDIPKPELPKYQVKKTLELSRDDSSNDDQNVIKTRTRPPPALYRMNLKHGQDIITPHELSTVIEVDSPMSVKHKSKSSRADTKIEIPDISELVPSNKEAKHTSQDRNNVEESHVNPDLVQSNYSLSKQKTKKSSTDSSLDSKVQMIDLKQFNDIMLQPFISIQEYAKQCNVGSLIDGSNLDDIPKEDDLSSMQSDGSLPDVIAELLKRKIISEPFKYDTASNVNTTTGSSESTLSVLALSKVRKDKVKTSVMFQDQEHVAESSDALSFTSNLDLENAFKKLGMGWASSTLKKTKERLALSSSSNTSSSSMSQFKTNNPNAQDIPALVTDSVSSVLPVPNRSFEGRRMSDNSKTIGQQTSYTKTMTVKEFLTNELANKITFTNKTNRNDTEEEFVSLFETKMPEEMKHSSQMIREERSIDSGLAGSTRARTSTPVQIFKSLTYHSSSSSNVSNGLFSNADDLSSVKVTSNSIRNHSTSDKDDLTIPNCSLRIKKIPSDASKSD